MRFKLFVIERCFRSSQVDVVLCALARLVGHNITDVARGSTFDERYLRSVLLAVPTHVIRINPTAYRALLALPLPGASEPDEG